MISRNIIDFDDITLDEWKELYKLATSIKERPENFRGVCSGRLMATLFYEPSTRTQMSFQSAMMRLGGKVIGFSDPGCSSVSKGETLRDTVKIVTGYSDILVIRNPIEGAAFAASLYSHVPVINAGDGGHLHPTQTLTDLMTITEYRGSLSGLKIGFCGDLLNGRTVHSLLRALVRFGGNKFILISTPELRIPSYLTEELRKSGVDFEEVSSMDECLPELDVLYMTRIQRERFASLEDYNKQSGIYRLTKKKMESAKKDLIVLHPLPKIDEIDYDVDDDPRALYFEEAENGMYVRMALIASLINVKRTGRAPAYELPTGSFCRNPRCISNHEKYLPKMTKIVDGTERCCYCDQIL